MWARRQLSVAGSSGDLALVEGLANQSLDDGLPTDVQVLCGCIQLFEHGCREVHVDALNGFHHFAGVGKKRETSLPLSAMRATASAEIGFFLERVFFI